LKVNAKMTVYNDFPHGFLSFDLPNGMSEAKTCIKDAAGILSELLTKW